MQLAITGSSNRRLALTLIGILAGSLVLMAQTPKPATEPATDITATSANVNGAGEEIKFHITKWSTDAERDQLSAAWSQAGTPAAGGARGRGGAARGGAAPADAAGAPAAANAATAPARGGRGGEAAAPPPPKSPEVALADALKELPSAGYFWTSSEVAGYLIRYAYRLPQPDGGSRIILLTDRRLGSSKNNWRPTGAETPNNYEFSLIELRLPAKAEGEGKASITGKLAIDPGTRMLALDGYETLPVVMKGVKLR